MIPSAWYTYSAAVLWQVFLHSLVTAGIFYFWLRRIGLPSGRTRRWLLGSILILPMLTASLPGREGFEFREQLAWLDSYRVIGVPIYGGLRIYHLALFVGALTVIMTLWQELLPAMGRLRARTHAAPEHLARSVKAMPGWKHCVVGLSDSEAIVLETSGWPWRPRLIVSSGALENLSDDELGAALDHEHAHWQKGRWLVSHLLFIVRFVQCYNPIALWCFREYLLELEIDCDADAVRGRDPRLLARALLKSYEADADDPFASRGALRKRIEILLGDRETSDDAVPSVTVVLAVASLGMLLPWIV